jgi:hypothetical protein
MAIKSYVKLWVCYSILQLTTSKRKYLNIQAPERIGYQSLTKTKRRLSKEEEEKEGEIMRINPSPPIAIVCRDTLAPTIRKETNPLLQRRSVVSCRTARSAVHARPALEET